MHVCHHLLQLTKNTSSVGWNTGASSRISVHASSGRHLALTCSTNNCEHQRNNDNPNMVIAKVNGKVETCTSRL